MAKPKVLEGKILTFEVGEEYDAFEAALKAEGYEFTPGGIKEFLTEVLFGEDVDEAVDEMSVSPGAALGKMLAAGAMKVAAENPDLIRNARAAAAGIFSKLTKKKP